MITKLRKLCCHLGLLHGTRIPPTANQAFKHLDHYYELGDQVYSDPREPEKRPLWKWKATTNLQFLGSMLVFGGVISMYCPKGLPFQAGRKKLKRNIREEAPPLPSLAPEPGWKMMPNEKTTTKATRVPWFLFWKKNKRKCRNWLIDDDLWCVVDVNIHVV